MLISLLVGTIIALGSMIITGAQLNTSVANAPRLILIGFLVTFLDPVAILLYVMAIALIVLDSRYFGTRHRRLTITALGCFLLWACANIFGFLPLSLLGMQLGSLALIQTGQMVKATAALLQYMVPLLLVVHLTTGRERQLLYLAAGLTVVGNFFVVTLPISTIQLAPVDVMGQTWYMMEVLVDYTQGIYPLLLALGWMGGALYALVYALLRRQLRYTLNTTLVPGATITPTIGAGTGKHRIPTLGGEVYE